MNQDVLVIVIFVFIFIAILLLIRSELRKNIVSKTSYFYDKILGINKEYELYIATDYVWREIANKSGYIVEQKFNWLQDKLSFIKPEQYIFLVNKRVLDMDIRIDDKINNLDGSDVKLLFGSYHNREYTDGYLSDLGIERMNSWIDIRNRLLNNK